MSEWVEIIRVLGPLPASHPVQAEIRARLEETRMAAGLTRAILMSKVSYGGDFGVVLLWKNEKTPAPTREGLVLVDYLRQFGSVDHAAWQVLADISAVDETGKDVMVGRNRV